MSKLKLNITMSIDGFVAGPDQSPENPLGIGGEELHDWIVPLKAWRESHGLPGIAGTGPTARIHFAPPRLAAHDLPFVARLDDSGQRRCL